MLCIALVTFPLVKQLLVNIKVYKMKKYKQINHLLCIWEEISHAITGKHEL